MGLLERSKPLLEFRNDHSLTKCEGGRREPQIIDP